MLETLKFGKGNWANKTDSTLAYSDQYGNFQAIPFDFTRATTATRVNKQGLIESVNDGIARIDYSDSTQGALLLEPQRTNLFQYSNDFNQWTTSGTITSGQDGLGVNPDAWIYQNSTPTSAVYISNTLSGVQTMSGFFKKNSTNGIRLFAFGDVNCNAYFDLNNGTVDLQQNIISADIVPFGDDWFRCSITFNQTNTQCSIYITNNANTQVLGEITMQYMQLELGSYPTSYIPTNGATATRNQEICNNATPEINSEEGVLYAEIAALANDGTRRYISLNNGTNNYDVRIYFDLNGYISVLSKVAGTTQVFLQSNSYTQTDFNKVAFKYKENDFALWINGVKVATDTSGITSPENTLNQLDFNGNNLDFFGNTKDVKYYPKALTDAQLQTLTTI